MTHREYLTWQEHLNDPFTLPRIELLLMRIAAGLYPESKADDMRVTFEPRKKYISPTQREQTTKAAKAKWKLGVGLGKK